MANNILKGVIVVDAPNIGATTNKVVQSTERMATSLKRVVPATNQASLALINLGRVAQDAPFGIIGIANNLNPLLESFQRTRKEAGSLGATFKALGASLLGGGGLGLALSLVTGALSFFALSNRGAKKDVDDLKDKVDVAAEKQKEFSEAVDKAAHSVVTQAKDLTDLRAILISTSSEVTTLTDNLIKQGLAQFLFDKKNVEVQKILTAEIKKQLKLREQNDIRANVVEFNLNQVSTDPLTKQIGEAQGEIGKLNALGKGLEGFFAQFIDGKKKVKDSVSSQDADLKKLAKAIQAVLVVPEAITFSEFDTDKQALEKARKTIQGFLDGSIFKLKIQAEVSLSEPDIKPQLSELTSEVLKVYDNIEQTSNLSFRTGGVLGKEFIDGFKAAANSTPDILDPSLFKAINDELARINLEESFKRTADTIAGVVTPAIQQMAKAIGQGENAFKAFGNAVTQILQAVVAKLIETAVLAAILSLITGGSFQGAKGFGGIFGKLLGARASGGPVSGGGAYLVGEKGPEIFVPNTGGNIVPNHMLGGGSFAGIGGNALVGTLRIRGRDLLYSITQENLSRGRNN